GTLFPRRTCPAFFPRSPTLIRIDQSLRDPPEADIGGPGPRGSSNCRDKRDHGSLKISGVRSSRSTDESRDWVCHGTGRTCRESASSPNPQGGIPFRDQRGCWSSDQRGVAGAVAATDRKALVPEGDEME